MCGQYGNDTGISAAESRQSTTEVKSSVPVQPSASGNVVKIQCRDTEKTARNMDVMNLVNVNRPDVIENTSRMQPSQGKCYL